MHNKLTDPYRHSDPEAPYPDQPRWRVILAHGAGAGMDSPFLTDISDLLTARGIAVTRFEFPYMTVRRQNHTKRPPDRMPILLQHWHSVVADVARLYPDDQIAIAGKSMGGRAATMLAAEPDCPGEARAVITLGYPFHPPGKPEKLRVEHLPAIRMPVLMLQGTRDSFGFPAEVVGYSLPPKTELFWIEDGDHDLKPRKITGRSHDDAKSTAADQVKFFLQTVSASQ